MPDELQPASACRIACLVPSLTLLLVRLGLGPWLVARTGFCIHPAQAVREVSKVGGTKDVNMAKLQRLAPTHVLVNVDENRLDTVQALREWRTANGAPLQLIVTHPCGPGDHPALLDQLAAAFGELPGVAQALAAERAAFAAAWQASLAPPVAREEVLCLIWRGPWMSVARDTYISRLLAHAGLMTLPDTQGGASGAARYPVLRGDEPWLADVRWVLLPSEPYRFEEADVQAVQQLCPQAECLAVDGEALSWHGGMAIEGLQLVRQLAGRILNRLALENT